MGFDPSVVFILMMFPALFGENPGLDSFAKGLLEEFGQLFGSLVQSGQWTLTGFSRSVGVAGPPDRGPRARGRQFV